MSEISNLSNNKRNINPILSELGFDVNTNRSAILPDVGDNLNYGQINQEIPERSICINKVSFRDYDYIVDLKGDGTHRSIFDALNEAKRNGGGSIYLKNGEYFLTGSLILDSNIYLIGEDKQNTILNLGAYSIYAEADVPYITGTISITNGDATVTGSGTSWLANVAAGDYMVFNGNYYKVLSVTDDTHLELSVNYYGRTLSLLPYFVGTFKNNISVSNFTIKGQSLSAAGNVLYFRGCVNIAIKNVLFKENDLVNSTSTMLLAVFNSVFSDLDFVNSGLNGLNLADSDYNQFSNINSNGSGNNGVALWGASGNTFNNINCNNNSSAGVVILDDYLDYHLSSSNNCFVNLNCISNNRSGLYIQGSGTTSADNNLFINSNFEDNLYQGIEHNYANYNNFINSNCSGNGDSGILIDLSSSGNKIQGCNTSNNGTSGVQIRKSHNNIINGNFVTMNKEHGIYLKGSYGNLVSTNEVVDNGQKTDNTYSEIQMEQFVDGGTTYNTTYNNVSDNRIDNTTAVDPKYGIREESSAVDYNIIANNIITNAQTANLSIQGVNTINDNNIAP